MKRYEFTGETMNVYGTTVRRIRAAEDIFVPMKASERMYEGQLENIAAGTEGGWIESESNLSQDELAWVGDNAVVSGEAQVRNNALACGRAQIMGRVTLAQQAQVADDAKVSAHGAGHIAIGGQALVSDEALVCSYSGRNEVIVRIDGHAKVKERAVIGAKLTSDAISSADPIDISYDAEISGNAKILGGSNVLRHAVVRDSAVVVNSTIGGYALVEGESLVCDAIVEEDAYVRMVRSVSLDKDGKQVAAGDSNALPPFAHLAGAMTVTAPEDCLVINLPGNPLVEYLTFVKRGQDNASLVMTDVETMPHYYQDISKDALLPLLREEWIDEATQRDAFAVRTLVESTMAAAEFASRHFRVLRVYRAAEENGMSPETMQTASWIAERLDGLLEIFSFANEEEEDEED